MSVKDEITKYRSLLSEGASNLMEAKYNDQTIHGINQLIKNEPDVYLAAIKKTLARAQIGDSLMTKFLEKNFKDSNEAAAWGRDNKIYGPTDMTDDKQLFQAQDEAFRTIINLYQKRKQEQDQEETKPQEQPEQPNGTGNNGREEVKKEELPPSTQQNTTAKKSGNSKFASEFKKARAAGQETFEVDGKKYKTMMKGEDDATWKAKLKFNQISVKKGNPEAELSDQEIELINKAGGVNGKKLQKKQGDAATNDPNLKTAQQNVPPQPGVSGGSGGYKAKKLNQDRLNTLKQTTDKKNVAILNKMLALLNGEANESIHPAIANVLVETRKVLREGKYTMDDLLMMIADDECAAIPQFKNMTALKAYSQLLTQQGSGRTNNSQTPASKGSANGTGSPIDKSKIEAQVDNIKNNMKDKELAEKLGAVFIELAEKNNTWEDFVQNLDAAYSGGKIVRDVYDAVNKVLYTTGKRQKPE